MIRPITTGQAIMILMLSMGLMNHVIVLPSILGVAHRDSWISAIFTGVIYLLWIPLVYYIIKKANKKHLIEWLKESSHPIVAMIVKIILLCVLLLSTFVTLFSTFTWVNSSYMPQTPKLFLIIPFIIICFFAAEAGIKTIAVMAGLLLPFVIIFGFFIMTANIHYKDYSLLFPIFEHGFGPTLRGAIYLGGGLVEIFFLVLMQQHVRTEIKFSGILFLSLFIIGINFGPIASAIAEFGPQQAAEFKNPAYTQWRMLTIGKYLNRLDFLSIYQWLSGAFVRVSISLFLIADLLQIKSKRNRTIFLSIISIGYIIANALPINDPAFKSFLNTYYFQASLIGIVFITFFISITTILKKIVRT
ncbi:endospore germination permease [Bacillus sp. Bva_UNVM-123]|uniref:endospore germination permease n=1 Tax=Bacillus sp. Bva_UNVM-123 TaxID=2829798 RepID=UPI00391F93FE